MKSLLLLGLIAFMIPISLAQEVRITFLVTVPDNTPKNDTIYITGNHRKLGLWSPQAVSLKKVSRCQYQISFTVRKNSNLHFKFTRGNWKTVEKDKDFYERVDRSLYVKKAGVQHYRVENWGDFGTPRTPKKHTRVGNIREHKKFHATKLNNDRTIWVYLPPSYKDENDKRYPVLYAHDGNNMFDSATAFMGVEWELDENAEKLIREQRIREVIIVAIENTSQRESEYTHVHMPPFGGGKANLYADFIIDDLKPFIDKNYRTLKDRQYTAVMGSSLGGLVSLYLVWKYPQVFSMAAVISPSVWWADRDILDMVIRTRVKPSVKIWLDIGTLEGAEDECDEISYAVKDTRDLRDALLNKGFRLHQDLEYLEVEGGVHNESAWAKRVDKILLFLYGNKRRSWKRLLRFH